MVIAQILVQRDQSSDCLGALPPAYDSRNKLLSPSQPIADPLSSPDALAT